jgi:hypothetical protein
LKFDRSHSQFDGGDRGYVRQAVSLPAVKRCNDKHALPDAVRDHATIVALAAGGGAGTILSEQVGKSLPLPRILDHGSACSLQLGGILARCLHAVDNV